MIKGNMDTKELIEYLQRIIDVYEPILDEEFNPYDAYGGNMDDAYSGGYNHGYDEGRLDLAEYILKVIKGV